MRSLRAIVGRRIDPGAPSSLPVKVVEFTTPIFYEENMARAKSFAETAGMTREFFSCVAALIP